VPGSTAATSIQTINNAITNFPVTNPINTADFTKVSSSITGAGAVSGIGPMSKPEVNGVLAQAKNLTNQLFSDISNSKGLGAFGLSIGQLETAGYVKPGTKAKFDADFSQFSNTIKSPAIWTGKDGVKNATDLLANPGKQSQIQQDLMTKGVAGLGAVGIPVQNLSSQGIAGMSLNAAKDLPSAEAFVKGLPIPGDATGSVQASFNSAVRDGAFAVNLVNTKVPTEFKQQDIPVPKSDTVNRETLDAASTRVVGDPKVPVPDYGGTPANDRAIEYINKATPWINQYLNVYYRRLSELESKVTALQNQQTITQAEWDAVDSERESIKTFKNEEVLPKLKELATLWDSLTTRLRNTIISGSGSRYDLTGSLINKFDYAFNLAAELKQKIDALKTKIEGAKV
jgi:hypothetical protein